ncbi:hypothetical protein ACFQHO_06145 [Actinomadura yumaensis]|uniref:hypothetical protein n=1 Tax=Actinomadura yumaensis TaxID=111807 RepID=UPI00360FAB63
MQRAVDQGERFGAALVPQALERPGQRGRTGQAGTFQQVEHAPCARFEPSGEGGGEDVARDAVEGVARRAGGVAFPGAEEERNEAFQVGPREVGRESGEPC